MWISPVCLRPTFCTDWNIVLDSGPDLFNLIYKVFKILGHIYKIDFRGIHNKHW